MFWLMAYLCSYLEVIYIFLFFAFLLYSFFFFSCAILLLLFLFFKRQSEAPELGGELIFFHPQLKIPIPPRSSVFANNMHPDLSIDLRTLHIGCPILVGSKWLSVKYVRHSLRTNNKQCGTDRDKEPKYAHLNPQQTEYSFFDSCL